MTLYSSYTLWIDFILSPLLFGCGHEPTNKQHSAEIQGRLPCHGFHLVRSLVELRVGYPAILTLCILGGLFPGQNPGNPIGIQVGQSLVLFAFLNLRFIPGVGNVSTECFRQQGSDFEFLVSVHTYSHVYTKQ